MTALSGWERNDFSMSDAGQVPFGDCFAAERASFLENMNRHNERHIAHADMHLSFTDLIARNGINERGQTVSQNATPTRLQPEPAGIGDATETGVNPINTASVELTAGTK